MRLIKNKNKISIHFTEFLNHLILFLWILICIDAKGNKTLRNCDAGIEFILGPYQDRGC